MSTVKPQKFAPIVLKFASFCIFISEDVCNRGLRRNFVVVVFVVAVLHEDTCIKLYRTLNIAMIILDILPKIVLRMLQGCFEDDFRTFSRLFVRTFSRMF